jgi:hypothetical protein
MMCWDTTHIWTISASTTTSDTLRFDSAQRCHCGLLMRQEIHPLTLMQVTIERLEPENTGQDPHVCPKCKSSYWDRERTRARRPPEGSGEGG